MSRQHFQINCPPDWYLINLQTAFSRFATIETLAFQTSRMLPAGMEADLENQANRPTEDRHNSRYLFTEIYPHLFSAGAYLVMYGFFELILRDLCDQLNRRESPPIALKDVAGRGTIEKARTYLRLFGVKLPSDLAGALSFYGALRNIVAHDAGLVPETKRRELLESLDRHAKRHNAEPIKVDGRGVITISQELFRQFRSDVEVLLQVVTDGLHNNFGTR